MKDILLIQTGGTISMQLEQDGTAYIDRSHSDSLVRNAIPEIGELANIHVMNLFAEDSSNIYHKHWAEIAVAIRDNYSDYDGFVILHGTDTMAFTASALSFALQNLTKPVILTGSQVPLINLRSDARRNVINAVEVATLPLYEVAICFNDQVFRGNRTSKMSIGDFDAYRSPNFHPLATIGLHIDTRFEFDMPKKPLNVEPEFSNHLRVFKIYPGLQSELLIPTLNDDVRALIIESFGSGNIPVDGPSSLIPLLEHCRNQDIIVLMTSQAPYDDVDLTKYESAMQAAKLGALSARDMTFEAAVTKLMHLLGKYSSQDQVQQELMIPIAGEMTL